MKVVQWTTVITATHQGHLLHISLINFVILAFTYFICCMSETFLRILESKAKYSSQSEVKAGHFEDFEERLDSYTDTV